MFSDRAKISVTGGRGGDGALSFRREAHVPRGGPDGGDGGHGGDVVLVCDSGLRDLRNVRRRVHYQAVDGAPGGGGQRHGASGGMLEIPVPPGTVAEASEGGFRYDLTTAGQRALVARGGSGGRGNARFATATRQTPRFAERGLSGESDWLTLRLKLLADAGLVGLPNAGKSSLLARLTRAHPKVADYPFTTLEPVLGTLERSDRQIVVADIPGLIAGASEGTGLGHDFLAHIERTSVICHVLELAPIDQTDPLANYATVERELANYAERLAELPRVFCLSKADLVPARTAASLRERLLDQLGTGAGDVVVVSSVTGEGLSELANAIMRLVPREPAAQRAAVADAVAEHKVYRPRAETAFQVERTGAHHFRVVGTGVERLIARHNTENPDAMRYVEERLRALGVLRALDEAGYRPGDEVEIAREVFELDSEDPRG